MLFGKPRKPQRPYSVLFGSIGLINTFVGCIQLQTNFRFITRRHSVDANNPDDDIYDYIYTDASAQDIQPRGNVRSDWRRR